MSWTQIGSSMDGPTANDLAGTRVAISNDGTIVAFTAVDAAGGGTARGEGYVYTYSGGSWTQRGSTFDGATANDELFSVALSADGSRVAFGQKNAAGGDGRVDVWDWNTSSYDRVGSVGEMIGPAGSDEEFGTSIDLDTDGDRIIVGSALRTSGDRGRIKMFELSGGSWGVMDINILGISDGDTFGRFVAMNGAGDKVVASGDGNHGSFRAFEWGGASWSLLDDELTGSTDQFGISVDMNLAGDRIVVCALTGGTGNGYTKVYEYSSSTWSQLGSTINESDGGAQCVSINNTGDVIAIGNPTASSNAGLVKIYQYSGGSWTQVGSNITGSAGDLFGSSCLLSGTTGEYVVIGAINADPGAVSNAGSTYVYRNTALADYSGGYLTVSGDGLATASGDGMFTIYA